MDMLPDAAPSVSDTGEPAAEREVVAPEVLQSAGEAEVLAPEGLVRAGGAVPAAEESPDQFPLDEPELIGAFQDGNEILGILTSGISGLCPIQCPTSPACVRFNVQRKRVASRMSSFARASPGFARDLRVQAKKLSKKHRNSIGFIRFIKTNTGKHIRFFVPKCL